MLEFTAADFDAVCRGGSLLERLSEAEEQRRQAMRTFWMWIGGGAVLSILAIWMLARQHNATFGIIIAIIVMIGAAVMAGIPVRKARTQLKQPVLDALAKRAGMEYLETGFDPPVYPDARQALFGSWLSSQRFTDLFWGNEADGKRFAIYEAHLERGNGKNRHVVFQGQVYAFQRSRPGHGTTVIVPDRGLFNFFKPAGGMQRMPIEQDPAFDKKFEVYTTEPLSSQQLLASPEFRAKLLELRQAGRMFIYVGAEDALVAISGKDRFEPGSMMRAQSGEDRARLMFDDLCGAMGLLRTFKGSLG